MQPADAETKRGVDELPGPSVDPPDPMVVLAAEVVPAESLDGELDKLLVVVDAEAVELLPVDWTEMPALLDISLVTDALSTGDREPATEIVVLPGVIPTDCLSAPAVPQAATVRSTRVQAVRLVKVRPARAV